MKPRFKTTRKFDRHYEERISTNEKLVDEYVSSVALFFADPLFVGDHQLQGTMKDYRAFWINNDYRVVYQNRQGVYLFKDIGTHDQVYLRRIKTSRVKGKELL